MGKGDKKSKHGKIILGSFGVRRPRRKVSSQGSTVDTGSPIPEKAAVKPKVKTAEPKAKTEEPKPKVAKKPKTEPKFDVAETQDAG